MNVKSDSVDRRKFLTGVGAATALGLSGCLGGGDGGSDSADGGSTGGGGSGGAITIGVLAPLNFQQGKDIRDGVDLATRHLNAEGGVNGRDLTSVVKDYKGEPAQAKQLHRELVLSEGADFTTGIFGGAAMLNTLDSVAQQQKIHFTNGAATNELEPIIRNNYDKYKYHFRTVGDSRSVAKNFQPFVEQEFSGDTVALIYEDFKWTKPFEEVWQTFDTYDVAYQTRFSGDTEDYTTFYDKMESRGVDHCITAMAFVGTTALTQWARQKRPFTFGGVHNFMGGSDYWKQTDGLTRYGWNIANYIPGIYLNDRMEKWLTGFQEQYDRLPTYTGMTSYDAVLSWANAANAVGTLNEEDVIPQLEEQSITGAQGTIEFHGKGSEKVHDLVYGKDNVWSLILQWQKAENPEGDVWPGAGKQACVYYGDFVNAEFQTPHWI